MILKKKTEVLPDGTCHYLTVQSKDITKEDQHADKFGLRNPIVQEHIRPKLVTSIVERVSREHAMHQKRTSVAYFGCWSFVPRYIVQLVRQPSKWLHDTAKFRPVLLTL